MATSNNLGLYLPVREDYISVKRDLSDNYELIDAAAGKLDIIINGNTASQNVTTGQYVTVLNSTITGITDGLYKSLANVSAGNAFTSSNLQAVTSGALNDLYSTLNTQIAPQTKSFAFGTCYKFGKLVVLSFNNNSTNMSTSGYTLPYTAKYVTYGAVRYYNGSSNDSGSVKVDDTKVYLYGSGGSLANGTYLTGQVVYMTDD